MRLRIFAVVPLAVVLTAVPAANAVVDGDADEPVSARRAAAGSKGFAPAPDVVTAVHQAVEAHRTAGDVDGVADPTSQLATSGALGDVLAAPPPTMPEILSPTAGSTVTGVVTVTASSTAPVVRFAFPSQDPWLVQEVTVVSGEASVDLPTWGANGDVGIAAQDCDELSSCGSATSIQVDVDNAAPVITRPAARSVVGTSFVAQADAPGGAVKFLIDGTSRGGVDTTAPYSLRLYTDGLEAGEHRLTAALCNDVGTRCAANPSAAVTITVKRTLAPRISAVTPDPFSPGRDGRRDVATVKYELETAQVVRWRVTDSSGRTIIPARNLGTRTAGRHQFSFNGKKSGGTYLPSGRYVVHLDTTKSITNSTLQGHAMRRLTVDRTPPRAMNRASSVATIYPVRDGYRDSARLSARLSERVTSLSVEILNRAGKKVRTIAVGGRSAGQVKVQWNGRRSNGALLPEGTYGYRFAMQDAAGNRATSATSRTVLSHKQLVKRSGIKTVTARGSVTDTIIGVCSDLFSPGARGWKKSVGYYSDYYACSVYEGDDLAAAVHSVWLPRAVRYGSVRVDAYGGRAVAGYNDVAAVLYYTGGGQLSETGKVLGSATKTYRGPTVGSKFVSSTGRVRWVAATISGNFYDIKTFSVRFTYFVLR